MATCHDQIFSSSTADTEIPINPPSDAQRFTLEAPHPQTTTPGLSLPPQKFNFCSRENANFSFKLLINGSLWFSQKNTKQKNAAEEAWQIHPAVRARGVVGTSSTTHPGSPKNS